MEAQLQIERTVDDLAEATIVGMQASGVWARAVATNRRGLAIAFLLLAATWALILHDLPFAVAMAVAGGLAVWLTPRGMLWSVRRRLPRQMGDKAAAALGPRTVMISDAGLSDSGSGITTTVAWDRFTDHIVTADRHVFLAGMAAIIDIPRRGETTAVDRFAARTDARMAAARAPQPA
jgi:hypothetical protein